MFCSLCRASLPFRRSSAKKQMHTSPLFRLLIAILLAYPAAQAYAQVKCTMPNGVVITQQLGGCPNGALKAHAADGTVLPLPSTPAKPAANQARTAAATPSQPAPPATPRQSPQPSAYEYAHVVCKAFEQAGATTCDVKSNILSDSTIETTLATSPASAVLTCNEMAAIMRSKTRAFEEKNWKILIFSPFSGNRPIAACKL